MATGMESVIAGTSLPLQQQQNMECERWVRSCGFGSSSIVGLKVEPSCSKGMHNAGKVEVGRGILRMSMSGGNVNPLPTSHKLKSASVAALEQLRNASVDRYTSEKNSILVLGLSVHSAPVEMREKLAVPEAEWPRAIEELCALNHIEEAAVLSTCNRMEIYVVALSWHRGVREVTEWMSKTSGIPIDALREHLFIFCDRDASQHLFRVASGLDSLVLGEGQILAQVKQVFKVGQGAIGFGRNLNGLFKQAITAGKRVRCETSIAAGAVSVSSAAVELAALKLPNNDLSSAKILVVGAGKMAKLLVKHLTSKGCTRMTIVNRTEQKVQELQAEFTGAELTYQPLEEIFRCAEEADVIFTSTAAEKPLFLKEDVESFSVPHTSPIGMRIFIDIAVPRNVGACVAQAPHARVYNVDDLKEVVAANREERRGKALEAQVIILEELRNFESWRDSLETVPTIKKLRAYAEKIRVNELEKCCSKMGENMSKKDRKLIEDLSRGIVNKLLHGPMQHLRSDGSNAATVNETVENMHALERMFDLKAEEIVSLEEQLRARAVKV